MILFQTIVIKFLIASIVIYTILSMGNLYLIYTIYGNRSMIDILQDKCLKDIILLGLNFLKEVVFIMAAIFFIISKSRW